MPLAIAPVGYGNASSRSAVSPLSFPVALKRIRLDWTRKSRKTSSARSLMMFRQFARVLARLTWMRRFRVPVSKVCGGPLQERGRSACYFFQSSQTPEFGREKITSRDCVKTGSIKPHPSRRGRRAEVAIRLPLRGMHIRFGRVLDTLNCCFATTC